MPTLVHMTTSVPLPLTGAIAKACAGAMARSANISSRKPMTSLLTGRPFQSGKVEKAIDRRQSRRELIRAIFRRVWHLVVRII